MNTTPVPTNFVPAATLEWARQRGREAKQLPEDKRWRAYSDFKREAFDRYPTAHADAQLRLAIVFANEAGL